MRGDYTDNHKVEKYKVLKSYNQDVWRGKIVIN